MFQTELPLLQKTISLFTTILSGYLAWGRPYRGHRIIKLGVFKVYPVSFPQSFLSFLVKHIGSPNWMSRYFFEIEIKLDKFKKERESVSLSGVVSSFCERLWKRRRLSRCWRWENQRSGGRTRTSRNVGKIRKKRLMVTIRDVTIVLLSCCICLFYFFRSIAALGIAAIIYFFWVCLFATWVKIEQACKPGRCVSLNPDLGSEWLHCKY